MSDHMPYNKTTNSNPFKKASDKLRSKLYGGHEVTFDEGFEPSAPVKNMKQAGAEAGARSGMHVNDENGDVFVGLNDEQADKAKKMLAELRALVGKHNSVSLNPSNSDTRKA